MSPTIANKAPPATAPTTSPKAAADDSPTSRCPALGSAPPFTPSPRTSIRTVEDIAYDWSTDRDQPWLTPTTGVGEDSRTQPIPAKSVPAERSQVAELRRGLDRLQQPAVRPESEATELEL